MKKIYMVTDLGPGDGGKGGIVHALSQKHNAHTIVKVGGAQGSHGVRTAASQDYAFSQFGCGTFEGVRTHISKRFVADPIALLCEADDLQDLGVIDPLSLLTVSREVLCTTIFHMAASQLSELLLRDSPRGTIGSGVGQAYRLNESHPELSIYMHDLSAPGLRAKLAGLQSYYRDLFEPTLDGHDQFRPKDSAYVTEALSILYNESLVDVSCEIMQEAASQISVVGDEYLAQTVLRRDGVVVSESSHGVLTDCLSGFHPHTSALRTLPQFARAMYQEASYDGQIVSLGVHRAYQIRHGAGPMVTHDVSMSEELLPGSNKDANRWQGEVRVGPLDFVSLRYALNVSGVDAYDGLAITWFDQIRRLGEWQYCNRYCHPQDPAIFTPQGDLVVKTGDDDEQLKHLNRLTNALQACTPEVATIPLDDVVNRDALFDLCDDTFQAHLGLPVHMLSLGSTEIDKIFHKTTH